MARVIINKVYRVTTESTSSFVECKSKKDLLCFVKWLVSEGVVVTKVVEIKPDGSTPKVRVFTDNEYKKLPADNSENVERSEMIGQIIDQLEDLLSDKDEDTIVFKGDVYDKASDIIKDTLSNYGYRL